MLVHAQWAEEACTRADPPSVQALRQGVAERVAAAGGRVDYVEVRHALELMSLGQAAVCGSGSAVCKHPELVAC